MGVCMFPAPLRQLPAYPVCNASMKACLLARTLDFLGSRTRSMHTGPCLVMRPLDKSKPKASCGRQELGQSLV